MEIKLYPGWQDLAYDISLTYIYMIELEIGKRFGNKIYPITIMTELKTCNGILLNTYHSSIMNVLIKNWDCPPPLSLKNNFLPQKNKRAFWNYKKLSPIPSRPIFFFILQLQKVSFPF